jgi:hypothetical protein
VLFDCDEVDEDPYIEFVPMRRAHAWYGNNYAAKSIPTQNARTVLTRGVLDHTAQTINPRWQVLNGPSRARANFSTVAKAASST